MKLAKTWQPIKPRMQFPKTVTGRIGDALSVLVGPEPHNKGAVHFFVYADKANGESWARFRIELSAQEIARLYEASINAGK